MSDSPDSTYPSANHFPGVVVVGAGPVGLCLALGLQRQGVPVLVIEASLSPSTQSRASTFHPPTLELLHELGVADALIAMGLKAEITQFRDRKTGPVANLDMGVLAHDTAYPFRLQCEQYKLCDHIEALMAEHIRLGVSVSGVTSFDDYVQIDLLRPPETESGLGTKIEQSGLGTNPEQSGLGTKIEESPIRLAGWKGRSGGTRSGAEMGPASKKESLTAWMVIGADGAHSAVRKSMPVDFEGLTYPERFLVVSTREPLDQLLPGLASVNYVADPDEWLVILQTPDHWRVLFPTDDSPDDEVTHPDVLEARLQTVAPLDHPYEVFHTTLYKVHRRVASSFVHGRIALAGDAAHINSPLGGMGMNSGIQDAAALWRRLGAVWRDERSLDEALAEYDAKRRAIAIEYVGADTHKNWQVLREPDPAKRAEFQSELRATAADPARTRTYLLRTSMLDAVRNSL
jgi:2-polyprenyl-6-methoxyphenol hydroxylase-like FAD-dependent oxidoreductase